MNCRELIDLLMDYLEGDLPEEVCVHIREHLHCCPACGHFCRSYEVTVKVTRKLPPAPMPQSLCEKLNAALKELGNTDDRCA